MNLVRNPALASMLDGIAWSSQSENDFYLRITGQANENTHCTVPFINKEDLELHSILRLLRKDQSVKHSKGSKSEQDKYHRETTLNSVFPDLTVRLRSLFSFHALRCDLIRPTSSYSCAMLRNPIKREDL